MTNQTHTHSNPKPHPLHRANSQRHQNQHHSRRAQPPLHGPQNRHLDQRAEIALVHRHQPQRPHPSPDRHARRRRDDPHLRKRQHHAVPRRQVRHGAQDQLSPRQQGGHRNDGPAALHLLQISVDILLTTAIFVTNRTGSSSKTPA